MNQKHGGQHFYIILLLLLLFGGGGLPSFSTRKVGSHQQKYKRRKPGVHNYLGRFASAYTAHQVNSLTKPIQFLIFLTAAC